MQPCIDCVCVAGGRGGGSTVPCALQCDIYLEKLLSVCVAELLHTCTCTICLLCACVV